MAGNNVKSAAGATHFYDNKLTGFVNKYLKKTGVTVTKEEIGSAAPPVYEYRLMYDGSGDPIPHGWTLEGHGVHRRFENYFDAINEQHKLYGDIPRATLERDDHYVWVHWDEFPDRAGPPRDLGPGMGRHGQQIEGWGSTNWGPFSTEAEAARETEDLLVEKARTWTNASTAAEGTPVFSIPVTDEVRAFVDQGQALFQTDPLFKDIKRTQGEMLPDRRRQQVEDAPKRRLLDLMSPDTGRSVREMVNDLGRGSYGEPRVKGAINLHGEGNTLHLFKGADVSTAIHELGHAIQDQIPAAKGMDQEEFARSFERYVMTAHAPTSALREPFSVIRDSMEQVYADKDLNVPANPKLDADLSRFFRSKKGEGAAARLASFMNWEGGAAAAGELGTAAKNLPSDMAATAKDILFQEDDLARDESLANTYEPVTDKSPEEVIRSGMKRVGVTRGKQEAQRSEERARRAAAFAERLRTADGLEGFREASKELQGEYPKIDFHGFDELTPEALHYLVNTVRDHPTLMPFQKLNLVDALDAATRGKTPTPSEQRLIEHVFGKETARGLQEIHGWPKHLQNLAAEVLNVPRSIMASFDLSAPFRQGLVAGARHPMIFAKNFKPMLRSFKSEHAYQGIMEEIKSRATYPLMVAGKLAITDMEAVDNREEQFYSNLAEKLTGGTKSPVRMSGRAYTAFLVKMRADMFDHLVKQAQAQGRDVHSEKFLKDLSRFINSSTGRGPLYFMEHAAPTLNTLFFSPRLLASRLDLLLSPVTYARADPFARRQALQAALQTAGIAMTVLGFVSQMVPGVTVNLDPRNADFGKIRYGNTRLDILGGFQQPIRLAAQVATSTIISSTTGRKMTLGSGRFGAETQKDIIERFFQSKLAPVPSIAYDKLQNKDFTGNTFSWKREALQHMTPLLAQDAADLYNQPVGGTNGIAAAVGGYLVGSVGFGLQTYSAKNASDAPKTRLQKEAKAIGFQEPPQPVLDALTVKSDLDSISSTHQGDPNKELDAVIDYYTKKTGDNEYERYKGDKSITQVEARSAVSQLRGRLIGSELTDYEHALNAAYKAQGKVPKP